MTCKVELPDGIKDFRITHVRAHEPNQPGIDLLGPSAIEQSTFDEPAPAAPTKPPRPVGRPRKTIQTDNAAKRPVGRPRKIETAITSIGPSLPVGIDHETTEDTNLCEIFTLEETDPYKDSKQKESDGLMAKVTWHDQHIKDLPKDATIHASKFVNEMKNIGTSEATPKSRLVATAWNDPDKSQIMTQSPTVQRMSQRGLIAIYPTLRKTKGMDLLIRDISQAYIQSGSPLRRKVYLRPPKELGLPDWLIWECVLPLYGMAESGNIWFGRYYGHHKNELYCEESTYDPCFMVSNTECGYGIVALQTDDTLIAADKGFAKLEQDKLEKAQFLAKERITLSVNTPIKFYSRRSVNARVYRLSSLGQLTSLAHEAWYERTLCQRINTCPNEQKGHM